ncbi:MAG: CTP synthase [Bdellovibrionaceae bacterium]|nr:CTP synthase [Pseudobdellovibrionaceae bacterium]
MTDVKEQKESKDTKYIFITGGVVSSIGKGLTAASLGALLEARGYKISLMKCDPYINVDPGTMSPLQHGEVYVTNDGAETDLDLGHYERFTSVELTRAHSTTAGQVYESVISRERRGDYLGGTVQVIPHITDEIKNRILRISKNVDISIVEIGGTVGDIEGLPFIESIRQLRADVGFENSIFIHVTYIPYIAVAGELKSKPTQHSVKELRAVGIQPDFLVCRSDKEIPSDLKSKIGLFCSVHPQNVIGAQDSSSIYEVPLKLFAEELDAKVCKRLELPLSDIDLTEWKDIVDAVKNPKQKITVGLVGKYVDLKESYKSLHEAINHAGIKNRCAVEVKYIDSETLTKDEMKRVFKDIDAVLVPGAFGERGAEGKITAIQYARENKIPFLGICFGMQMAVVEYARNMCGLREATSREFVRKVETPEYVIDLMEDQKLLKGLGGTMRLGAFPCDLKPGSVVHKYYGEDQISERHRHRFEFNNKFKSMIESKGLHLSGVCSERDLVEIVELPQSEHPFYVGVQFHPEFQSKPLKPHPLFFGLIKTALDESAKRK